MKGKIMAAVAVAVLSSATGLAGTGAATAAAPQQPRTVINGRLCDALLKHPLCWADDGHKNSKVTTEPYRKNSQDQATDVIPETVRCPDGALTDKVLKPQGGNLGCPFTGSLSYNLNFDLAGQLIVNIFNHDSGLVYMSSNDGKGILANVTSGANPRALWVQVGCTTPGSCGPSDGAWFINVAASSALNKNTPVFAFTRGSGKQIALSLKKSVYWSKH